MNAMPNRSVILDIKSSNPGFPLKVVRIEPAAPDIASDFAPNTVVMIMNKNATINRITSKIRLMNMDLFYLAINLGGTGYNSF